MSEDRNGMLVKAYMGKKCQCGRPKHERQPFCFTCWNALEDVPGRNRLPHLFGEEYAVLYMKCIDVLTRSVK
jgi:hypothetical protein